MAETAEGFADAQTCCFEGVNKLLLRSMSYDPQNMNHISKTYGHDTKTTNYSQDLCPTKLPKIRSKRKTKRSDHTNNLLHALKRLEVIHTTLNEDFGIHRAEICSTIVQAAGLDGNNVRKSSRLAEESASAVTAEVDNVILARVRHV